MSTETPVPIHNKSGVFVGFTHLNVSVGFDALLEVIGELPNKADLVKKAYRRYEERAEGRTSKHIIGSKFQNFIAACPPESVVAPPAVPLSVAFGRAQPKMPGEMPPTPAFRPIPAPSLPLNNVRSFVDEKKRRDFMERLETASASLLNSSLQICSSDPTDYGDTIMEFNGELYLLLTSATVTIRGETSDIMYEVNGATPKKGECPWLLLDDKNHPFVRSIKGPQGGLPIGDSRWVRAVKAHEGMRIRFYSHNKTKGRDDTDLAAFYMVLADELVPLTKDEWQNKGC